MTRLALFIPALFVALLHPAAPARSAEPSAPRSAAGPRHPFRLKLGALFSSGGRNKEHVGRTWLAFGASYDVRQSRSPARRVLEVYFDGTVGLDFGGGAVTPLPGDQTARGVSTLGIGVAVKDNTDSPTSTTQTYLGVGAGVYRVEVDTQLIGSETKLRPGVKALAGVQGRSSGLLVEASYTQVFGHVRGVGVSGLAVQLGYRF